MTLKSKILKDLRSLMDDFVVKSEGQHSKEGRPFEPNGRTTCKQRMGSKVHQLGKNHQKPIFPTFIRDRLLGSLRCSVFLSGSKVSETIRVQSFICT